MNREVHLRRINHDFSPPDAIEKIADTIANYVDPVQFNRALRGISAEAYEFWRTGNG